jgi:hypothetical protein
MALQPRRQTLAQTTTMVCPQNNNMMDIRIKIYKKSPEHDSLAGTRRHQEVRTMLQEIKKDKLWDDR